MQEADKHIGIAPIDKEDCLSTRGFVSGARATMMVVGTAAAVGLALVNDRRLTPVLVEAAPQTPLSVVPVTGTVAMPETSPRDAFARRFGMATLIGVAVLFVAASIPAVTAMASNMRSSSTAAPAFGPPLQMRAAAGVSGNWERSYSVAAPDAGQLGAALLAGISEQRGWDVLKAMHILADQQAAAAGDMDAAARIHAAGVPFTLSEPSGLAAGTVLRARITIYGCQGPGGGFCNHMSAGGVPFEGAAACSSNLPFGTKITIDGDPTGRTYECLDRGALAATWIDVYFENTTDGIAWQSTLGSTVTDIHVVN